MSGKNDGGKGNPASKRIGNAVRKTRRSLSWQRGERRKAKRREEQAVRTAVNVGRRRAGELTPWELAKAARAERRANDPEVQKRAAKHGRREAA